MYNSARSRRGPPTAELDRDQDQDRDRDPGEDLADNGREDPPAEDDDRPAAATAAAAPNPKPWETVVRIKVHGNGSIGFGSGTIIHSTPQESIILTCAHIFKLEGRQQAPPAKFPREIAVDLFDGTLRGQQVHYAQETYPGKAIDYDFTRDVGLIRIRPGRKLPAARVVPAHWKPRERMLMTTVGCSEGRDATAWNTTIIRPSMQGSLTGNPQYEAIECVTAPKQGRSGGGLFTSDGYVAGVCDFAEPRGNRGLYATPTSIYSILDRNKLALCYAPIRSPSRPQTLLADAGGERERDGEGQGDDTPSRRRRPPATARMQSPDRDESNTVMIPPPELLGIKTPSGEGQVPARTAQSSTRGGWQPTPAPRIASRRSSGAARDRAETTELTLDPELDSDHFGTMPAPGRDDEPAPAAPARSRSSSKWRPVRTDPAR
jgi:hypothetical protein